MCAISKCVVVDVRLENGIVCVVAVFDFSDSIYFLRVALCARLIVVLKSTLRGVCSLL